MVHRPIGRRLCAGFCAIVMTVMVAACVGPEPPREIRAQAAPMPEPVTQFMVELVFGRTIDDRQEVSDADWDRYVEEILVRKTEGFTIADCQGGWLDAGRVMRERCKLVILFTDARGLETLKEAVTEYRRRFRQQSVLWMERPCPHPMCRFEGTE